MMSVRVVLFCGVAIFGASVSPRDNLHNVKGLGMTTFPLVGTIGSGGSVSGTVEVDPALLTVVNGGGGEAGRLKFVSSTEISFKPHKGDKLPLNGAFVTIPGSGFPGGTVTNAFVNGVAGETLAANMNYYVYAFDNGGVPTIGFRNDGGGRITGAGGIEVRASAPNTPDNTHTLLGLIRTSGNGQFIDTYQQRYVRSWFNERGITATAKVGNPAGVPQSSTYPQFHELTLNAIAPSGTPVRAYFLSWAGETCDLDISGEAHNEDTSGQNRHVMIGAAFNGQLQPAPGGQYVVPLVGARGQFYASGATAQWSYGGADSVDDLPEGLNYASLWGESETGIGHFGGIDPYRARVRVRTFR